ncbi:MAG: YggT family protein [Rhodospirillaceae bacterium]|nr:YggT family protein [Rhodospirillaceae bacterium]
MCVLLELIFVILRIFTWLLIAYIVLSLLLSFGVINAYNRFVNVVFDGLQRLIEPVLGPIRRFLPRTGALDFSPIVLFIGIWLIERLLTVYVFAPTCAGMAFR